MQLLECERLNIRKMMQSTVISDEAKVAALLQCIEMVIALSRCLVVTTRCLGHGDPRAAACARSCRRFSVEETLGLTGWRAVGRSDGWE